MKVVVSTPTEHFLSIYEMLNDVRNMDKDFTLDASNELTSEIKEQINKGDVFIFVDCNDHINPRIISYIKRKKKRIITIGFDKTKIPKSIENEVYIKCDLNSKEELFETKVKLEKLLSAMDSEEFYKKRHDKYIYAIVILLALSLILFLIAPIFSEHTVEIIYQDSNLILMPIILVVVMTITTLCANLVHRRNLEQENQQIETYSYELEKAILKKTENISDNGNDKLNAIGLMMVNLGEIKRFYTWSQKQAKGAFILATSMCISGLVLIACAVIIPLVIDESYKTSFVTAIGGVIIELVAGTALVVYKNSLEQFNYYHRALHEDERFLSSVNLVEKINEKEHQDEIIKEIIRSEVKMNLLEVSKNDDSNGR